MKTLCTRIAMAVLASAFAINPVMADPAYPSKPIKLLVGYPPGQATDTIARLLAERAGALLKQPIIVENKAGQGGSIALGGFINQPADGYSITLAASGSVITNTYLYKNVTYQALNDLTTVGFVADLPLVLVANPKMPFNDMNGLVEYARNNPGKLNFASPGVGTSSHLAMETLKHKYKLDLMHVPYQGSVRAMTDLIAGEVDIAFDTVPAVQPHVNGNKLKAMAIGSSKRLAQFPDVPTLTESGYDQIPAHVWIGLFLPKGSAPEVTQKLNQAFNQALSDKDIIERTEGLGVIVRPTTPEEFTEIIRNDQARLAEVVKNAGLEKS
ncbi:tripartite tricarboxylate transporter substrate binding protein [Alcaligenaceae bacterium]|nr:tripartite tricarboxylate transporter substrate binding protein [Alcaligenaceae bacterium]